MSLRDHPSFDPNDPRDVAAAAWGDALATGDPEVIEAARDRQLTEIHTRIMSDDPNYQKAGWTP